MPDPRLEDQSEEVQEAVQKRAAHEAGLIWLYAPWNWVTRREEAHREAQHPLWKEDHYEEWTREALLWRIQFLQAAGRWADIQATLLAHRVLPIVFFLGLVLGMLLR